MQHIFSLAGESSESSQVTKISDISSHFLKTSGKVALLDSVRVLCIANSAHLGMPV